VKFVLAPDSFKESMSAVQAVNAMRLGVLRTIPDAEFDGVPMADGGEGTVDAQTMLGTTPFGVAQIARRHNTPAIHLRGPGRLRRLDPA
jgi:glycerate kinase